MIETQELLKLNSHGFIPGPTETIESFKKRVELTKKLFEDPKSFFEKKEKKPPFNLGKRLKKPDRHWAKNSLINIFDISPDFFSAFLSNEKLRLFQGAATWVLEFEGIALPILQIRQKLEKGAYLRIYELEDILAHELAHFARAAFTEPKFEEFFAYFSSSKLIRRFLGPIAISSLEISLFIIFLFLTLASQYMGAFFQHKALDIIFIISGYITYKMVFVGAMRLAYRRWIFNRCLKKLKSILVSKEKAMAVMFRLTDKEIKFFAKSKKDQILSYFQENKESSLRWLVIYHAYLKNI